MNIKVLKLSKDMADTKLSKINWHEYIHKANEEKSEIASLLVDNEKLLVYAEKELNKARTSLPDIVCVSNDDMDPKNIILIFKEGPSQS